MRHHDSVSFVAALLLCGCPPAISWFVIAIVVNPIQGMLRGWTITHVVVKVFLVTPSFADGYSASTVVRVIGAFLAFASPSHSYPRPICWGIAHAMCACAVIWFSTSIQSVARYGAKSPYSQTSWILSSFYLNTAPFAYFNLTGCSTAQNRTKPSSGPLFWTILFSLVKKLPASLARLGFDKMNSTHDLTSDKGYVLARSRLAW